ATPNAEAVEAWNTVLFDKFVRFRHLITGGLGLHGDLALARYAPRAGARALDVGCGFADTTLQIARIVGDAGRAVGVDAAANFIAGGRREVEEAGARNVDLCVADVQTDDLGGPYDYAFSRMGVMFFASPVAAFRNVRRALAPGARLCVVVWRKREDNAF